MEWRVHIFADLITRYLHVEPIDRRPVSCLDHCSEVLVSLNHCDDPCLDGCSEKPNSARQPILAKIIDRQSPSRVVIKGDGPTSRNCRLQVLPIRQHRAFACSPPIAQARGAPLVRRV